MTNGGTEDNGALADLGPRPWLILGGGGVKGMAHVGAWRLLRERGADFEGVIGCSIGALVAACIAADMDVSEMYRITDRLQRSDIIRINRRAVWVNGIREESVFRGDRLREYIASVLPVRTWEELWRPLQINAVDLSTGEAHWFGTGARTDVPLLEAVYASSALPVFYPPARFGGGFFVDGGVDQSLPLHRGREVGASGILAVDCGAGATANGDEIVEDGMIAIHQRVMSILIRRRRIELLESDGELPRIVVRPDLEGYGTFDFESIPYFLEAGYRSAAAALEGSSRPAPSG